MGRLTDIDTALEKTNNGVATTTRLQQNSYAWRSDGILRSRMSSAGAAARSESFGYDLLNRLTSAALTVGSAAQASCALGYAYNRLGNVTGRNSTTETNLESTAYRTQDRAHLLLGDFEETLLDGLLTIAPCAGPASPTSRHNDIMARLVRWFPAKLTSLCGGVRCSKRRHHP